jgi:hypothetical protein
MVVAVPAMDMRRLSPPYHIGGSTGNLHHPAGFASVRHRGGVAFRHTGDPICPCRDARINLGRPLRRSQRAADRPDAYGRWCGLPRCISGSVAVIPDKHRDELGRCHHAAGHGDIAARIATSSKTEAFGNGTSELKTRRGHCRRPRWDECHLAGLAVNVAIMPLGMPYAYPWVLD